MKWSDDGIILSSRPHGESHVILGLLTENHGRHLGMVRRSKKKGDAYQIGTIVTAHWRGRLDTHLGFWQLETVYSPLPYLIHDSLALLSLQTAATCLELLLPERAPHPRLMEALTTLIRSYAADFRRSYVNFEGAMLIEDGMRLDFSACAATGSIENLCYVSPKSGRAVSRDAGAPYHDYMLPLPLFLLPGHEEMTVSAGDFYLALSMLSFFLDRFVFAPHHVRMPTCRHRFVDAARRLSQQ